MTKGRAIKVVDEFYLRRVRQATRISSDLEYKGLKNKQQERTPEKCKEKSLNHLIKYQEDLKMTKGRVINVVDEFYLRRVRQATRISSDLEYKGLKNKQQERTPEKCKEKSLNHLV
ncbi:unnamed protein product [Clavelina lepadiformis]|uniref:Uncharacterized protein n=1 Tax=Clavelina lepadiformis TaxID=159417 RepID=A0ABP0EZ82_CLALP